VSTNLAVTDGHKKLSTEHSVIRWTQKTFNRTQCHIVDHYFSETQN